MELRPINLKVVADNGDRQSVEFDGLPLGRVIIPTGELEHFKKTVEIYQTEEGSYLIHVSFENIDGEINLANYVKTVELSFSTVRTSLKESGLYPGPAFSEALYHAYGTLELIQ